MKLRLRHIGLNVSDLDASTAFYCNYLGFREGPAFVRDDGTRSGVFLYLSDGMFLELFAREPGPMPGHLCFEVDDVHAAVAELRAQGLDVSDVAEGKSKALMAFFKDPDGYPIELNEFSSPASWIANYLATADPEDTLLCGR